MRADRFLVLCFGEALRGLIGHRRTAAPAVAIIAVSLVVLGGFLLVSNNMSSLLERWRERGHVQIFLRADATNQQVEAIAASLNSNVSVEDAEYLSPEDAAEQFREDFVELGNLFVFLDENPLPASFVVTVNEPSRQERALVELARQWETLPGVEDVQYDLQIIRRLELGVNSIRFAGGLLGLAVLLAAVITTANVIRVLVVERRREIIVLRMVGSTESLVRGRFLAEGAIQGLLGGLIAMAALYGAYKIGVAYISAGGGPLLELFSMRFLGWRLGMALIGSGVLAGILGAWMAFGTRSDAR
jgi:cell division transport system permease protein